MAGVKDQALKRLDSMADEVIQLVSNFIQIESTNPKYPGTDYDDTVGGEGDASRYVAELFKDAGAEVDLFSTEPGRDNAVGVISGKGGGRSLILNGHVDAWSLWVTPKTGQTASHGVATSPRARSGVGERQTRNLV